MKWLSWLIVAFLWRLVAAAPRHPLSRNATALGDLPSRRFGRTDARQQEVQDTRTDNNTEVYFFNQALPPAKHDLVVVVPPASATDLIQNISGSVATDGSLRVTSRPIAEVVERKPPERDSIKDVLWHLLNPPPKQPKQRLSARPTTDGPVIKISRAVPASHLREASSNV